MYEFECVECGHRYPYKAQVYDNPKCIYCDGSLAVVDAQQSVQADGAWWLCKVCRHMNTHSGDICSDCNSPRR
jgi:hypothetical protein